MKNTQKQHLYELFVKHFGDDFLTKYSNAQLRNALKAADEHDTPANEINEYYRLATYGNTDKQYKITECVEFDITKPANERVIMAEITKTHNEIWSFYDRIYRWRCAFARRRVNGKW